MIYQILHYDRTTQLKNAATNFGKFWEMGQKTRERNPQEACFDFLAGPQGTFQSSAQPTQDFFSTFHE